MISENTQIALLGLGSLISGIFVIIRRTSLARANAKKMVGRSSWTRFDYSEEYFRFLGLSCGVFFCLIGVICLLSAIFRDGNKTTSNLGGGVIYGIVAIIFLGVLISIFYANYKFGNKK